MTFVVPKKFNSINKHLKQEGHFEYWIEASAEMYREASLTINSLTSKTSRYKLSFAIAPLNSRSDNPLSVRACHTELVEVHLKNFRESTLLPIDYKLNPNP